MSDFRSAVSWSGAKAEAVVSAASADREADSECSCATRSACSARSASARTLDVSPSRAAAVRSAACRDRSAVRSDWAELFRDSGQPIRFLIAQNGRYGRADRLGDVPYELLLGRRRHVRFVPTAAGALQPTEEAPAGSCDQPIDLRTVRPLLRRSKPSASAHQWEL